MLNSPESRRRFLQDLARGGAMIGLSILAVPTTLAAVEDFTESLIGDQWSPMNEGFRSKLTNRPLSRIHDSGMAAQYHDLSVYNLTGERVYLQQEMAGLAGEYQNEPSAGYCHAGVNAYLLGERVLTLPGDYPGASPLIKDQLLRIKHADDYQVPLSWDKSAEYLVNGQKTGIYLNEDDESGLWIKAAFAYNPETGQVYVSAFGFTKRWSPIDRASGHYLPVHAGSEPQDSFVKGVLEANKPRLDFNRSLYDLTQKRVNVIDHLTYLVPL